MLRLAGRVFFWAILIGAMFLVSCGGGESPTEVEEQISQQTLTSAPTPTEEQVSIAEDTSIPIESCEAPAAKISLGSPVSADIVGADQPPPERKYFCVEVPDGATNIQFELTGMTSDLNMYIGHPDLETVQNGGTWFWYTSERGTEDKVIVVEPALSDYVRPGPYYIEVSPQNFEESSPFTLRVSTP